MIKEILILILVTFLPFFELRASIPLGVLQGTVALPFGYILQGFGMNFIFVFFICVATNALLGPLVYFLLNNLIHHFQKIRIFDKVYQKYVERTQRRIKPYIDKYGEIGVALFIGVPLPGSGSYSGALAAQLVGLSYKKFFIANLIGVTIAGILVTIVTLTGKGLWASIF